jgi:uncharacterized protein YdaU (DUF1376 family)
MHYYKFNIKDWTRDTAHLSIEEEGVYRRLIDHYYESEMPIPQETQWVIRRLRLATHEQALSVVLNEFFFLSDDGYHHARCDKEIKGYHGKAGANRENGKLGGRPKKAKENPGGFDNEPTNNLNHKPLTTNQEPQTSNQEKPPAPDTQSRTDYFDRFWKLYPKKKSKADAEKAWSKLKMTDEFFSSILSALSTQAGTKDWTKDGGQYAPFAGTWIRGKRWEDETQSTGSKHNGFAQIDYMDGLTVEKDGTLRF